MSLIETLRRVTQGGPVDWDAWLPVAIAAADDATMLGQAMQSLTLDEQYDLLSRLKEDGGPVADYLVCALAERAETVTDEQVRSYLLGDSSEALARRQDSLRRLAERLRATGDRLDAQRQEGFDAAHEVTALTARLADLRSAELEPGLQRMADLEWEIHRLQVLQSRLAGYDPVAREAERARLADETSALVARRDETERQVAAEIRARDEALAALAAAGDALEQTRAEAERVERERSEATARLAQERESVSGTSERVKAVRAELRRVRGQVEQLNGELSRLRDLESSPVGEQAKALAGQVRALYRALPADDADPVFQHGRARR